MGARRTTTICAINTNPDNVQGCYGYRTEEGYTLVHVFVDHADLCCCEKRRLRR